MATPRLRLTGDELRDLRRELSLTQAELARRLRVTRVTVARWEAGLSPMRPSSAQLIRFYARSRGITMAKRKAAQDVRERIDKAIASRPVPRSDDDLLPTFHPDRDGLPDWPKATDDALPLPKGDQP